MRPNRALRVARGTVAATVATFIALMSHLAGGGRLPDLLGVLVPWVLSVFVCTVLAGRRLSLPRLAVAVAVSQVLFHVLFVLGASTSSAIAPRAHMHDMTMPVMVAPHTMPAMGVDALMWAWHGVACLLTVVALHRGERAFRQLHDLARQAVRWARRRLSTPSAARVPFRPLRSLFVSVDRLRSTVLFGLIRRRGPPSHITI